MGFAILSGAGLLKGTSTEVVHVHTTSAAYSSKDEIDLSDALQEHEKICPTAPIFIVVTEEDGSVTGELLKGFEVSTDGKKLVGKIDAGKNLFVDFYIQKASDTVSEIQIDAANFAGYYYVEATTLFRRQNDGVDMPAELTFPNVKIQSNFTFNMASTGDPSTFSFVMDCFPGFTYFNPTRKVLCAMQVVEDAIAGATGITTVFPHDDEEVVNESKGDSSDEDNPIPPISASILTMFPQDTELLGKPVSDLISRDTYVCENGTIHGTLKYVKNYTDFSSILLEQSGYYFPFKLTDTTGTLMTFVKNGVITKKDIPYDPEILFRVEKPNTTWEVLVDDKSVVRLNFATAEFETRK